MAFFNDLSKYMDKVKNGAQKTADLARMQHQISTKQNEFDKLFCEIGKLYYSERQRGVQPDATMDALCDKVDALANELEDLKKKVDELRQVSRCPGCGAEQSANNTFCSACGAKLPQVKKEEAPEAAEEENRDVYINWPDGSAKEAEKSDVAEPVEEAAEETAETVQEDAEEAPAEPTEEPTEEATPDQEEEQAE